MFLLTEAGGQKHSKHHHACIPHLLSQLTGIQICTCLTPSQLRHMCSMICCSKRCKHCSCYYCAVNTSSDIDHWRAAGSALQLTGHHDAKLAHVRSEKTLGERCSGSRL